MMWECIFEALGVFQSRQNIRDHHRRAYQASLAGTGFFVFDTQTKKDLLLVGCDVPIECCFRWKRKGVCQSSRWLICLLLCCIYSSVHLMYDQNEILQQNSQNTLVIIINCVVAILLAPFACLMFFKHGNCTFHFVCHRRVVLFKGEQKMASGVVKMKHATSKQVRVRHCGTAHEEEFSSTRWTAGQRDRSIAHVLG